ncbi:fimbrial protein [Klebsiella oxytoca]|uniref:fimbrial protein n=1 Tax=Klebsiella oxytoca TaxID=571 RepID=UPI0029DDA03E|nr:fimbrial protein [Klebsiella oxytoca]MDX6820306.1 fimbrial protein [Klebsiella oxytoca]
MLKKTKPGTLCISTLTTGIALCILFCSQPAQAAIECRFNSGKGGSTTLVNGSYKEIRLPTPTSGQSHMIAQFDTKLTPTITGDCSAGNDGEDLWAKTSPNITGQGLYNFASFLTNIPGIEYQVRINTTTDSGNMFAQNTQDFQIISYNDGYEDNWDEKTFKATIYVYLKESFNGNPQKLTYLKPQAGLLGWASLGVPSDSNNQPYAFYVTEDTFSIPLVLPTCSVMALGDGGTNVAMGDYFISDLKNGNTTKDVPFNIDVSDCTSVAKFTTKMTTLKTTGSGADLLGNTLNTNAATGIGVKILYNKTTQLIPNNANSNYVVSDNTIPGSKTFNFIARMERDGNPLVVGQFKATAVFNMTYD